MYFRSETSRYSEYGRKAMRGLAKLGVDLTCVHAAGGIRMMEAAMRGLEEGTPEGGKRPLLLAITQLTSTSEEEMHADQLIEVSLEKCDPLC